MRQAPLERPAGDAPAGIPLELHDRQLLAYPMVEAFAAFRGNAYPLALYAPAGDRLSLAGWMLHLPWAKNPAPMNRSGARGLAARALRHGAHEASSGTD